MQNHKNVIYIKYPSSSAVDFHSSPVDFHSHPCSMGHAADQTYMPM